MSWHRKKQLRRETEKNKSKLDKIWNFIKSHQAWSSMAPLDSNPFEDPADAGEDEDDTTN